jgi:putative flavoprotein involved in K+ transport
MRQPSLQLVGDATRNIDIGTLRAAGIRCVGRAVGSDGAQVALSGDLAREMNAAAARMEQVLARIDAHIAHDGIDAPARVGVTPPVPPATAPTALDLARDNIRTVVWATGFRRDYGWLKAPALTAEGELRHAGGVTPVPGLYALGLPFQRRRNSTFIGGVGADAADIADLISIHLGQRPARAA